MIAGNKLRTFRTLLTGKYLKDGNKQWLDNPPIEPPMLYPYIPNDVWKEFVHQRYKEEFKVFSIQDFTVGVKKLVQHSY